MKIIVNENEIENLIKNISNSPEDEKLQQYFNVQYSIVNIADHQTKRLVNALEFSARNYNCVYAIKNSEIEKELIHRFKDYIDLSLSLRKSNLNKSLSYSQAANIAIVLITQSFNDRSLKYYCANNITVYLEKYIDCILNQVKYNLGAFDNAHLHVLLYFYKIFPKQILTFIRSQIHIEPDTTFLYNLHYTIVSLWSSYTEEQKKMTGIISCLLLSIPDEKLLLKLNTKLGLKVIKNILDYGLVSNLDHNDEYRCVFKMTSYFLVKINDSTDLNLHDILKTMRSLIEFKASVFEDDYRLCQEVKAKLLENSASLLIGIIPKLLEQKVKSTDAGLEIIKWLTEIIPFQEMLARLELSNTNSNFKQFHLFPWQNHKKYALSITNNRCRKIIKYHMMSISKIYKMSLKNDPKPYATFIEHLSNQDIALLSIIFFNYFTLDECYELCKIYSENVNLSDMLRDDLATADFFEILILHDIVKARHIFKLFFDFESWVSQLKFSHPLYHKNYQKFLIEDGVIDSIYAYISDTNVKNILSHGLHDILNYDAWFWLRCNYSMSENVQKILFHSQSAFDYMIKHFHQLNNQRSDRSVFFKEDIKLGLYYYFLINYEHFVSDWFLYDHKDLLILAKCLQSDNYENIFFLASPFGNHNKQPCNITIINMILESIVLRNKFSAQIDEIVKSNFTLLSLNDEKQLTIQVRCFVESYDISNMFVLLNINNAMIDKVIAKLIPERLLILIAECAVFQRKNLVDNSENDLRNLQRLLKLSKFSTTAFKMKCAKECFASKLTNILALSVKTKTSKLRNQANSNQFELNFKRKSIIKSLYADEVCVISKFVTERDFEIFSLLPSSPIYLMLKYEEVFQALTVDYYINSIEVLQACRYYQKLYLDFVINNIENKGVHDLRTSMQLIIEKTIKHDTLFNISHLFSNNEIYDVSPTQIIDEVIENIQCSNSMMQL